MELEKSDAEMRAIWRADWDRKPTIIKAIMFPLMFVFWMLYICGQASDAIFIRREPR